MVIKTSALDTIRAVGGICVDQCEVVRQAVIQTLLFSLINNNTGSIKSLELREK